MSRRTLGEFTIGGVDDIIYRLGLAGEKAEEVAARALYQGAGTIADAINSELSKVKTEPFRYADASNPRLPSPQEKTALVDSHPFGIAHFDKIGGSVTTYIGLGNRSGYVMLAGKYRRPIAVIARTIESGSSFTKKQPFFRTAVRKSKQNAQQQMTNVMSEEFKTILEE